MGKREGKLFQSLDAGNSWRDITPNLPLHFTRFKEIAFAGSTLYVATEEGVLTSETGEHWRVLTDSAGKRTIINRFAVSGTKVYGISDAGVYRLDTVVDGSRFLQKCQMKLFLSLSLTIDSIVSSTDKEYFTRPLPKNGK